MQDCPITSCGRKFSNQQALLQHAKRRHPNQYKQIQNLITKSVIQNQSNRQEQLYKLPKLNQILSKNSNQNKPKIQIYRRSSSKNKSTSGKPSGISAVLNDSRRLVQTGIPIKRPSIKKNNSQKDLNQSISSQSKLPSLNQHKMKNKLFKGIKPLNVDMSNEDLMRKTTSGLTGNHQKNQEQNFYTTLQGFGKNVTIGAKKTSGQQQKVKIRSKSKDRILSGRKKNSSKQKTQQSLVQSVYVQNKNLYQNQNQLINAKIKHTSFQQEKDSNLSKPIKKALQRRKLNPCDIIKPQSKINKNQQKFETKKVKKEQIQYVQLQDLIFEERTVVIKQPLINLRFPAFAKTQYLFLNNCQLNNLDLNGLQSLVSISLCHNNLTTMDFLRYGDNQNIQSVYLDYNKIDKLVIPPNLKILSISFNKIGDIDQTSYQLKRAYNSLQQIDFSFNPVRKQYNYKLQIISSVKNLKKIDGMKITKIDKQLSKQFKQLLDERKGIVPLSSNYFQLKMSSPSDKDRPSTAFTTNGLDDQEFQSQQISAKFIEKDIKSLQKTIFQTQQQLNIIKGQNEILLQQFKQLERQIAQLNEFDTSQKNPLELYQKLSRQCEVLQILNFMQYGSQNQLQQMIIRKRAQKQKQGIIIV